MRAFPLTISFNNLISGIIPQPILQPAMQLGGAPLCAKCSRPAYHAEQALGPGRKVYHRPCLTCHSCHRRLDPGSLVEHDGEAYCSRCHGLHFGTTDLRSANAYSERTAPKIASPSKRDTQPVIIAGNGALSIDDIIANDAAKSALGSEDDAAAFSPFRVTARDAPVGPASPAGPRAPRPLPKPPGLAAASRPLSGSNQFQGVPASALSPAPAPLPLRTASTIDAVRGSPAASKLAAGSSAGAAERCANENCAQGGRVYFAEGVNALGRRWHRACLRCTRCKSTLDPGKVSDREGAPYCKACYSKEFGPIGLLGKR